jgi:hypothetical protein
MVSRRRILQVGGAALAGLAGCLDRTPGDSSPSETRTHSPTDGQSTTSPTGSPSESSTETSPKVLDDGPTRTPGDVPDWSPEWTLAFDGWNALGLDATDGSLYVTLSRNEGRAGVAEVAPSRQSIPWQTEVEGEAVGGSHATSQGIARGQWGVTLTDETVYLVTGNVLDRLWTRLHAFDRESGERRWSVEHDRELGVVGVDDGLVIAAGLEFFPPPGTTTASHQTPESPLTTVLYGIDEASGSLRWKREFTGVTDTAMAGDRVYVATKKRLVGVRRDGTVQFRYGRGPGTRVAATPERAFYLTGERETATLHGVSPSGRPAWRHDLPVSELLVGDGRLYAGADVVVAVETDGTVRWRDDDYGQWLLLEPNSDRLYTRSGIQADAATAYDVAGAERWTFDPPSTNAWPEAATSAALAAAAITAENANDPFYTLYAVNSDGGATAARGIDTIFDSLGLDGTIYVGDGESRLLALDPS